MRLEKQADSQIPNNQTKLKTSTGHCPIGVFVFQLSRFNVAHGKIDKLKSLGETHE